MSYPFYGKEFTFTQPDGSKINVRGWGNQHQAVFETLDGFTVVKDPLTHFIQYAKPSVDKNYLEPTGMRADLGDPRTLGLAKNLRVSRDVAKEMSLAARSRIGFKRRCEERREKIKSALRMALMTRGVIPAPPSGERKGEYVGLCILIQFPDVPGSIQKSEVEDFCNKKGYSGFGNKGSVYDYFYDVSQGKFKYTNIVTSYYTTQNPKAYYTDPNISIGTRARQLIEEALSDLKTRGFDFRQLSVDDEGYIYALNVFYAGPYTNDWNEGLWPHSWSLGSPYDVGNGRKVYDYQITDMGGELTLATFCHENGHMVCDFPDLYDYGYQSYGVGLYCLMCYGGPDDKNPTQVCAYLKYKAGWADKVTLLTEGVNALKGGINDFSIYTKDSAEYFIIENRFKEFRDISLPDSGLAIWHIDEQGSNENEDMTPSKHYECSLEQADKRYDLEHRVNYGDAGDLFSAGVNPSFGDSTDPSSKWWDGTSSGLNIVEISNSSREMSFRLTNPGTTFCKTSKPGKTIPDNDQNGIRDVIIFGEVATVSSVKVSVDIHHPYRGDLRLILISPSGICVVLHDRKGGSTRDLKGTFDVSSIPDLRNFASQILKGDWTLWVQDLAASDEGRLESWDLEIEGSKSNVIEMEEIPATRIPDSDPTGIMRSLTVNDPGRLKQVEIFVDITHTYIGDLIVTLISPKGTSIDLHNRAGGAQDNIIKKYSLATTPALGTLAGQSIQGDWCLKIADLAGKDLGKLNRWSLWIVPM